jgi:hypothetical protein
MQPNNKYVMNRTAERLDTRTNDASTTILGYVDHIRVAQHNFVSLSSIPHRDGGSRRDAADAFVTDE